MYLPQTAEYALRAVLHIAAHAEDGSVRVNAMAPALGVPQNYLSKTLHQLARAGILGSTRGPTGGFRLARPATQLTIATVVAPFIDMGSKRCLLADRPCGEAPTCAVHERWAPIRRQMDAFFASTSIAELLADGPASERFPMLAFLGGRAEGAAAAVTPSLH